MSLVLNVEILGEFKKLTSATQGAQQDLSTMSSAAQKISSKVNKAFAAIGIGLSFRVIANELEEATKAAIDDRKSQELLALAMKNTGAATDDSVKSAEKAIAKMSIQAGIADDQLRPAYQKLFIATKDVTKSQDLLQIAMDASAATGKDLDTVSQAMAKALAGNDAALAKLIPSLKGSKTPIDDMAKAFEGASEKAANVDPYQKMKVIFGEIQEKIGTALLPVLDDFAAWMSSPPGQKQLQEIADAAQNVLTKLADTARWAIENKDWLLPLATKALIFAGAISAIGKIKIAIDSAKAAQELFNAATMRNPWVIAAVAAGASVAYLGEKINSPSVKKESNDYLKNLNPMIPSPNAVSGNIQFNRQSVQPTEVNININKSNVTATDITDALDTYYRTSGVRVPLQ